MTKPVQGTWAPNDARAPGATNSELITSRDGEPDTAREMTSVEVPYPEAAYWGRYGNKIFAPGTQPTIWAELGFIILANDGSAIVV